MKSFFTISTVLAMAILVIGIFVIRERYNNKIHFVPQNVRAIAH